MNYKRTIVPNIAKKKTNKPEFIAEDMPERDGWRAAERTEQGKKLCFDEEKNKTIHAPLWKYSLSWSWHDRITLYVFPARHQDW